VEGAGAEVLDAETREVKIPDLTAADVAFGTPIVYRARTVRDIQQLKTNREAASPTTTREFQRTDRLLVRTPAYLPSAAVAARILNRSGQPMSDLSVAMEGSEAVFEMPLASLPTGDYVLEISASGSESKELVAFRITS
jgi:hypothetical protein